ncbi:MAG: response regulator, partial [Hyphomicrobiales bacterium]
MSANLNTKLDATEPSSETNGKSGKNNLALIVDDSRLQRKILSSSVKQWGFDVIEADSGDAALALCEENEPDIVLSDWMMPGMNGLEFCKAFRERPGDHYGYFILLTSKSDKGEVAQGLDAGADDFLTKPVNAHELRARITAGERILKMQRELHDQNRLITETLGELQRLYDSLDNDLIEAKQL